MILLMALSLVVSLATPVGAGDMASLGYSDECTLIHADPDDCWITYSNNDGSFENGYAWQYAGVVPPYGGAFGEGFSGGSCGIGVVCARLWVTTLSGFYTGQSCDVYIWEGGFDNEPGAVASMTAGVVLGNVPYWPAIGANDVSAYGSIPGQAGGFTVGYWGDWPSAPCGYFVAADLDGPGGRPWTYIAPGIGYPTGWNDPSMVWGPTQSLGLEAEAWGGYTPAEPRTWGTVKALFD